MPNVCFYFQLHQPFRLEEWSILDIGKGRDYFGIHDKNGSNKKIFEKVSQKSYRPMLQLLLDLVKREPDFCFALSASGVFLEQAELYDPKVVELLKALAQTGRVEFLAETYYHSLASLYSPSEFRVHVAKQLELLRKLFNVEPRVFRNTELVYSNAVAAQVVKLGFDGMITEAVDRYLGPAHRTGISKSTAKQYLPLLLKHAQLSDDVAFRFSNKQWEEYPLTVDKYLDWMRWYRHDEYLNLFMDFETFGEHQWADTGIFDFFAEFVHRFPRQSDSHKFVTPSMVFTALQKKDKASLPIYDVPEPISWADVDRDLTAWIDNAFQRDSLRLVYELEKKIVAAQDLSLLEDWRKLQTSDHFYYMCTKWAADGDVHAYFSPYESPHEAYRRYSIVLADLIGRLPQ